MLSVYLKNHGIHEKSRNFLLVKSTARKIVLDLEENWKWTVHKYLFFEKVDIVGGEIWVFL